MNKIESFKYIRPISPGTTSCYSVGDILPIVTILFSALTRMFPKPTFAP